MHKSNSIRSCISVQASNWSRINSSLGLKLGQVEFKIYRARAKINLVILLNPVKIDFTPFKFNSTLSELKFNSTLIISMTWFEFNSTSSKWDSIQFCWNEGQCDSISINSVQIRFDFSHLIDLCLKSKLEKGLRSCLLKIAHGDWWVSVQDLTDLPSGLVFKT